jgi:hypothetical protein
VTVNPASERRIESLTARQADILRAVAELGLAINLELAALKIEQVAADLRDEADKREADHRERGGAQA